jgi:hypothetical protein
MKSIDTSLIDNLQIVAFGSTIFACLHFAATALLFP